ncbi:MAG: YfcE family phosphodiesterase [Candidatus Lokiarchaeota archaeon]|nr:YfcE family phosphodiesterase [Candidatus Lokiarchaeota archaeon]
MRIITLTDFHGTYPVVPKIARIAQQEQVDAIVIAGDITNFGPISTASQIIRGLLVVGVPTYWIPGNCDLKEMNDHSSMPPKSIHFAITEMDDYVFVGFGGSTPTPFPGMYEFSESYYLEKAHSLLGQVNKSKQLVIVSHVPPFGTSTDRLYTGDQVGSKTMREIIEIYNPVAFLCGHIHESRNSDYIQDTLIVNPGPAMNGYYGIIEEREERWRSNLSSIE